MPLDALQATWAACFHPGQPQQTPTPYLKQDPLVLNPAEVAAVVEVVCGPVHPGAASAVTGAIEREADPFLYWQERGMAGSNGGSGRGGNLQCSTDGGDDRQLVPEPLGSTCLRLIMKMIVDLWMKGGPQGSFPLVLRMLQQAVHQSHASYRIRAFDLLYNLSLHGCLLYITSDDSGNQNAEGDHAAAATKPLGGLGGFAGGTVSPKGNREHSQTSFSSGVSSFPASQQQTPCVTSPSSAVASGVAAASNGAAGQCPSPRSRLARGDVSAVAASSTSAAAAAAGQQQQQERQGLTSADFPMQGAPGGTLGWGWWLRGDVAAGEGGVEQYVAQGEGVDSAEGAAVAEVAFQSWLRELLFELLVMVAEVRGCYFLSSGSCSSMLKSE